MEDENQQTQPLLNVLGAPEPDKSILMKGQEEIVQSEHLKRNLAKRLFNARVYNSPDPEQADLQEILNRTETDVSEGLGEDMLEQEMRLYGANSERKRMMEIAEGFSGNPSEVTTAAQVLSDAQGMREFFSDVDGYEQMMIQEQVPLGVEDIRAQRKAVKRQAFGMVQELMDKEGILDTVVNAAGLFAPDYRLEISNLTESGMFAAGGKYEEFAEKFKASTPDVQNILIRSIIPKLYEEHDQNSWKVLARVEELFDEMPVAPSIVLNTALDPLAVADIVAVWKGFRALKFMNMSQEAVDNEAIKTAAKAQAAASTGRPEVEKITGISKVDAAHSMNPNDTSFFDQGASQNGLAAEIDIVKNSVDDVVPNEALPTNKNLIDSDTAKALKYQETELERELTLATERYKADQIALAGEKLPRGDVKALVKERDALHTNLKELKAKRDAVPTTAKGTAKVQQGYKAERVALNDQIKDVQSRVARLDRQLDNTRYAVEAEGNLSRLGQGVIPKKLQAELDTIRQTLKAAKVPAPLQQTEISQIMQGTVPQNMQPAIARETKKQAAQMQAEAARVAELPSSPKENVITIPKAERAAENIRTLMKSIIRLQPFSPEEAALAEKKAVEKLQAQLVKSGTQVNSMEVVGRTPNSVDIKYKTTSGEGEHTFRFTRDEVGSTNVDPQVAQRWVNKVGKDLFSKETLIGSFYRSMVGDTTVASQQAARIRNQISALWKESEAGLSKDELMQVDAILKLGDEEGIETGIEQYTIAELRSGTLETKLGKFALNDRQIESYYIKRAMYRELHSVMASTIRDKLVFEGFENLRYVKNGVATDLIGRRLKNFDLSGIKDGEGVYFPGDPIRTKATTKAQLLLKRDKLQEDGYRVVELFEPKKLSDGRDVNYALVKDDADWSILPQNVLNYSPGYVPRIYKPGYYFVRNAASETNEVLYAFNTKDEAYSWAKEYVQNGGKVSVYRDGEFGKLGRAQEDARAFGGLYTGPRKQQPLLVKTPEGTFDLDRMSVGQATERYINNIAKTIPLNEYRMAAIQRWENDVNAYANRDINSRSGLGKEQKFSTPNEELDLPDDVKAVFVQARDYIKDVMGVASKEESFTETLSLGIANQLYGKPWGTKMRDWALNHSKGSVSSWIKGHTFSLSMGWLNPAHLYVQMANMSTAFAHSPTFFMKAMPDTLAHMFVSTLPEAKAIEAAKYLKYDADTIQSLEQYHKSGLRAAIAGNADFDIHELGIAPTSLSKIRELQKKGLMLYRGGENSSRLAAWNTSRKAWLEKNPNKKIGDAEIVEISRDATTMLMNMQSENAATWQKGWTGIPLQFNQPMAKFAENILPRVLGGNSKWTRAQKMRVLGAQLALFGVVGVPVIEETSAYLASLWGEDPAEFEKNHPELVTQINEGVVGTLLSAVGLGDMNTSERLSLLAGMDNTLPLEIAKALNESINGGYDTGLDVADVLQGPSATTIKRSMDLWSATVDNIRTLVTVPSLEVAYGSILTNLEAVASMTSTWTYAEKAYLLNQTGNLYSSTGKLVATEADLGPMSLKHQLAIAMGMKLDKEIALYSSKEALKDTKSRKRSLEEKYNKALEEHLRNPNDELFEIRKSLIFAGSSGIEIVETVNKGIKKNINEISAMGQHTREVEKELQKSGAAPTAAQVTLSKQSENQE